MLGLDISTSMLAEDDTSVRRLTQAKEVIFSLLAALEGDQFGCFTSPKRVSWYVH